MPGFFILLPPHLRPGSLVNRASDSGSEGRGFESHRGHEVNPCKLNTYEDFFVIEFVIVVLKISKKRLKLFCC